MQREYRGHPAPAVLEKHKARSERSVRLGKSCAAMGGCLSARAHVYLVIDVRSADELRGFTSHMITTAGAFLSF